MFLNYQPVQLNKIIIQMAQRRRRARQVSTFSLFIYMRVYRNIGYSTLEVSKPHHQTQDESERTQDESERRAAAAAAAAALLEAADDAGIEQAQREAYARTIQAHAPRWFVVPFVFSSLGCLAEGAEEVMRALAARYAASEAAGGAEAAGHGILHARWLPRLSAAIERGAWGRLRSLLRDAVGAKEGVGLVVSELLCEPRHLYRRADALGAGGS